MSIRNELITELDQLIKTEDDRAIVIQVVEQRGKYNVNLGQGTGNTIGDNLNTLDTELLSEIRDLLKKQATSTNIITLDDEFFQLLQQRCLERIEDQSSKTRLYTKRDLSLESVYVPAFLSETCRQQRINKNERQQKLSVYKAIKTYPYMVIIGPPGIGKSTILNHIAAKEHRLQKKRVSEDNHFSLPVLIRLREISDNGGTLNIRYELGNIFGIPVEHVNEVLRAGKILLLLDGLDEISQDFRERICREVNSLSNSHAKHKIILTCRNAVTPSLAGTFVFLEVFDLDKKQQEKFIANYFSLALQDPNCWLGKMLQEDKELSSQKLVWKVQSNIRLQEIAQSPLLLSMICLVYISTGALPEKRSELYEQGINIYLQIWGECQTPQARSQSNVYQDIGHYAKEELLEELASTKFKEDTGYTQFSEKEIVTLIANHKTVSLDTGCEILIGLAADHGLLVKTSLGQWEFSHLTFQEFFVAKWIFRHNKQDLLVNKILEEKWQEVIRLVIELKPPSLAWFRQAKAQIDYLVASEDNLQALLQVTESKVQLLENSEHVHPYKQSAVRAFYYDLGINFSQEDMNLFLHHSSHYDLAHTIDAKLSDALEAEYEMDFVEDPYHDAVNIERELEQELWQYDYDDYVYSLQSGKKAQIEKLKAESNKRYKEYRDTSRELHPDLLYDSTILEKIFRLSYLLKSTGLIGNHRLFFTNGDFSRHEYPCTPYTICLSRDFRKEVQILIDKYFLLKSTSESKSWLEDFLTLIRAERKVGHVFDLRDEQRMLADRYYKANIYFVDLIKISGATTSKERAMLEDDILKPFAMLRDKYPQIYFITLEK